MKLQFSGWVNGLSMWPNLFPGDFLRTEWTEACRIERSRIIVFPDAGGDGFVVHRVRWVRYFREKLILATEGDSSGRDDFLLELSPSCPIRVVTGVLRRGNYRPVMHFRIPICLRRRRVMELSARLARLYYW